jgi:hypothetical protein
VDEPTQQAVSDGSVVIAATPVISQLWKISNNSPGLEGKQYVLGCHSQPLKKTN